MGKIILQWKKITLLPKGTWLTAFIIGAMFFTTITDLRSLALQAGELNHFPYTANKDGYGREEMVLWVRETTSVTKSESATC